MSRSEIARKSRIIAAAVERAGLSQLPKDPETGKWITAKMKPKLNTDRKKVRMCFVGNSPRVHYICPKCGKPIEHRKKMHVNLCMRCGQYLDWGDAAGMNVVWIRAENQEEAAFWAENYENLAGTGYAIDISAWCIDRKRYPLMLYFPFPDGKGYGRFQRLAAKEGKALASPE